MMKHIGGSKRGLPPVNIVEAMNDEIDIVSVTNTKDLIKAADYTIQ